MIREKIVKTDRIDLYMAIERHLSPFRKRNYTYTVSVHSDELATIRLIVVGRNGEGSISMVVAKDTKRGWTVTTMGYRYILSSLNELTTVSRTVIRRLLTIVNKF